MRPDGTSPILTPDEALEHGILRAAMAQPVWAELTEADRQQYHRTVQHHAELLANALSIRYRLSGKEDRRGRGSGP